MGFCLLLAGVKPRHFSIFYKFQFYKWYWLFFGCIHKSSLSALPPISDEAVIKNLLTGSESEQSVGLISSFLSSILLYSLLLLISLASYSLISDYNSVISVPWQKYHHMDHIHVVLALRGTHCQWNFVDLALTRTSPRLKWHSSAATDGLTKHFIIEIYL